LNNAFWLGTWTLWQRDVVRFLRQPSRVIGALVPPIVFWFLIGSGLGDSLRGANYLQYFFPGTILLIVLFSSIFSTISVIEDRHAGFLQGVLVAPLSRSTVVLGKILGGTTLAVGQATLFLLVAPWAGLQIPAWGFILPVLTLTAIGLTALGFLLAWSLDSTQGFHALMNLFLIPMWLLSGALFPVQGAAPWVAWLMQLNPLHYAFRLLEKGFLIAQQPALATSIGRETILTFLFSASMVAACLLLVRRRS
jgi:daunorubicin resistance ABC transporter membrane protein